MNAYICLSIIPGPLTSAEKSPTTSGLFNPNSKWLKPLFLCLLFFKIYAPSAEPLICLDVFKRQLNYGCITEIVREKNPNMSTSEGSVATCYVKVKCIYFNMTGNVSCAPGMVSSW